ncbi:TonB-dependent siderophore receptor [Bradyrhizobium ontarionense]|uniref:TonB-dependent siderophore receptor n=1 Tax=Bradyrhizobium ontarionense TaxID=2898149 RepID=A0ABY3R5X1_9BRAD|nr:TonB-dependent siderophore receptor [Bradyrhizobium sp. A19]UFZ02739.1 TonB-dependent siderophore receptor [Bradyrhizobium sp. A19]
MRRASSSQPPAARPQQRTAPPPTQTQLPSGVIVNPALPVTQTTAGPVQGYQALTATGSTRTNTPTERIPASINVVPRAVIDDQNSLSVAEATRNVSGVQATSPLQTPAYESARIRGFAAEQWLDGLTSYYNAGNRDSLVNVERIEVLKGPNAILYGGGSGAPLGGVINIVSKLPTNRAFSEFGSTFGSYGFVQPYFDINQPLSKDGTVLSRLTGEYTSSSSFIDTIDTKRYAINPTLLFTNKEDTTLTIQGRFSDWRQQEYQGLPAVGTVTGDFRLNRNLFIGPSNIPKSYSTTQSVTAKLDHEFNEVWSANVQVRAGKTRFQELAQDIFSNAPAFGSTWGVTNLALGQEQKELSVVANALAKFRLGISENRLLFGYDYSRVTDVGAMYVDPAQFFAGGVPVDLRNPVYPAYVEPVRGPFSVVVDGDNVYRTQGFYTQWQSSLWDRVHLLGGVRLANLHIDSVQPAFATTDITDVTKALPRVGAVVDLVKGFSVFADYSEGLKGNPFALYSGPPKPETSKQTEAGIKFNSGAGLSGTLAVFEINRSGVPISDPNNPLVSIPAGEQRSRGLDLDVLWQPTAQWSVLGSYAHVDAVLTKDVAATVRAGNKLNWVPADSGRLWVNYRLDGRWQGWSLGAGVYAASGAYVDPANLYKTSGYFTIDSKIAYDDPRYHVSLTFKNLTNEKYFVPYAYFDGRVAPGEGRTVYGKLALKFN